MIRQFGGALFIGILVLGGGHRGAALEYHLGRGDLAKGLEERLELYRQEKPYRRE